MKTINLNNLDKSEWRTYRFDEIAKNVSERVDPITTDLKVYIGLEHVDPESIHIRRTGTPDDVKGQKLKGCPGDVIFGKRRAYQRKASILTEESICSAHAFILRANPEVIDSKLFPFFLHSDAFMHRMIDISVGGLSPTINWGTLKSQEFLLPPEDQQSGLAELLWSMDEVIERYTKIGDSLRLVSQSVQKDFFDQELKYDVVNLGSLVSIKSGDSPSKFKFVCKESGVPFYKVKDMNSSIKYQNFAKEWVEPNDKKIVDSQNIIFPKRGAAIMTNKVRITCEKCHVDTNTMALEITDKSRLSVDYLYYFLLFKGLYKIADTAQIPQINNKHINPYPINLPPLNIQNNICRKLNGILDTNGNNTTHINSSKSLNKSLINQVF